MEQHVQRWRSPADVPHDFGATVVSIGNFDGVHRGHQAALRALTGLAAARGARSVAITFDPHPLQVLHPERSPQLIGDLDARLDQLEQVGLDAVLVMEFTLELAAMTPRAFVQEVLLDRLRACAVVVGEDIRFGVRNSGDLSTMRALGVELGFDVQVLADITGTPHKGDDLPVSAVHRRWSSSWVRELLAAGDVAGALVVLGRPHRVVGEVVHGDHRGRDLGFPTANLGPDTAGMVPADGVYAGWLTQLELPAGDPDRRLPAAISVGTNPTFEGRRRRRVEAYVLDRTDLDLYGRRVAVEFVERLRPTLTFAGIDALIIQMRADVDRCRDLLGG